MKSNDTQSNEPREWQQLSFIQLPPPSQVQCVFIRCWLVRVLIQTKLRSMVLEWRRQASRLMSQHTSPWTAVRLAKVSVCTEMLWVV